MSNDAGETEQQLSSVASPKLKSKVPHQEHPPIPLLRKAFSITVTENGWALLARFSQALRQIDPSFDPRSYGEKKVSALLRVYPEIFVVDDSVTYVKIIDND